MFNRKQHADIAPGRDVGEQGYLLLGLLFLTALIFVALAIAAPKIGRQIQREKELETVHRGEQYKRAIQLYYRKFGAYPSTIEQLKKTNEIRFLRQEYIDPMTGKKDWKILHLGEVQMQALGFFGQALATVPTGVPGAGMPGATGMQGAGGLGGTPQIGGNTGNSTTGSMFSDQSSTSVAAENSDAALAATYANRENQSSDPSQTASVGVGSVSEDSSLDSGESDSGQNASPSPEPGAPGGSGNSGGFNSGGVGTAPGVGTAGAPGAAGGGIFGSATTGAPGAAAGGSPTGSPIIGVTVPLKTQSMIKYRKQSVYDKWQFVYNPAEDLANSVGGGGAGPGIGTPAGASSPGSAPGQNNGLGGTAVGGAGIGSSSTSPGGFGSVSSSSPQSSPTSSPQ